MVLRCAGQDVKYNLGMIDDDNDSLSYSLALPLGGGNYTSPWSFTYPVTCLGGNTPNPIANPPTGFNLDARTGDIQFRPTQIQVTPVKIMVTEWRNIGGVPKVIGRTSRDMELTVMQPFNNTPVLPAPFSYNFCAGQENCFNITTIDQDVNDSTLLSSNSSLTIPGSTFDVITDTNRRSSGTFCWTPTANQVRDKPYSFLVKVKDNHCPVYAEAYRTYSIYVKPKFDATVTKVKHSCTTYDFIAANNETSVLYRKWEIIKGVIAVDTFFNIDSVLNYKFRSTGTYFIKYTSTNSRCTFVHHDTVVITNAKSLDLIKTADTTVCKGNSLVIGATPLNGIPPYGYKWHTNGSLVSTSQSFTIMPLADAIYILESVSSDTCKLNSRDTIRINVFPSNKIIITAGSTNLVYGQSTILRSDGKNNFNWLGANIIINWNDSVLVKPTVNTTYTLIADNVYGCRDTARITINVSNVGVRELRITDYELRVFPNPAGSTLTVWYNSPGKKLLQNF